MKNVIQIITIGITFGTGLVANAAEEAVGLALSPLFGDHMVLQQQTEAAIWGTAQPGTIVEVAGTWGAMTDAAADAYGKWMAELPTPQAGGPYEVEVMCGEDVVVFEDVLVGEVWIGSGQSNMEMPLAGFFGEPVENSAEVIADSANDQLRMFTVQKDLSFAPMESVSGQWEVSSPDTAPGFSATAYFFARKLQEELGIPVGVIHTSWGGTPAEAWTTAEAIVSVPGYTEFADQLANANAENAHLLEWMDSLNKVVVDNASPDPYNMDFGDGYLASADIDDSNWPEIAVPGTFESSSIGTFDGAVWMRKSVDLPANWEGKELVLELGAIDDMDRAFVNGQMVGRIEEGGFWQKQRVYPVAAGVAAAGKNIIAVRVIDTQGGGGMTGPAESVRIYPKGNQDKAISLAGKWRALPVAEYSGGSFYAYGNTVEAYNNRPRISMPRSSNSPTVLYNAMIHPLVPYGIRGAIWYQGEANVGRDEQYRILFPTMIESWRSEWDKAFSFYHVQIAPWHYNNPEGSNSAALRDAQNSALALPGTGQAVTLDIGDMVTIHPPQKREVGERLARIALARDYGRTALPWHGPVYTGAAIKDDALLVQFDPGAEALVLLESDTSGFEIVCMDGTVHPVAAKVMGNTVWLELPQESPPSMLRYAYYNNSTATLFNSAGLPAPTFSAKLTSE